MRVAIYARVSTDDKGQVPENQLRELRAWCINSGHMISHEYVEHESGRKGADRRKQFAALFDDAAKRKFDCVLFWALDRPPTLPMTRATREVCFELARCRWLSEARYNCETRRRTTRGGTSMGGCALSRCSGIGSGSCFRMRRGSPTSAVIYPDPITVGEAALRWLRH
jgi:hypothetical protein